MLLKIYPLALTIYGFYQTTEKVSFFALLLVCFMIIGWILQIVFEVFGAIFSNRFALIMDGVKADVEEIKRPVTAVGNFFKKITGKEVEAPKEPTKNQLKLREKVEQFRAERKEKRELQKQELIETICSLISAEWQRQGLITKTDLFLQNSLDELIKQIQDPQIASLPWLYG